MKIKKLVPEDIKDKKLEYKNYRKIVKPALKAMLTMHKGEEATTGFFIKTDYEFADMKGKKMGFIIIGDQTTNWLKLSKEEIKGDKKNTCIGDCYVKDGADGTPILVIKPVKGAAKKNLMKKQLEKFALKGTPFKIEIAAGGELEEDNPEEAVVDEVEVVEEEEVVEAPKSAEEEKALAQQVNTMIKSIAATYTNTIKAVVVPRIKAGDPEEAHLTQTESLLDTLDEMQELYNGASAAVQNALKEKALKVLALVPNLEKIKHVLNQKLGKEPIDTEEAPASETPSAAAPAANAKEALELSKKLMDEINAIANELDIFAMA